MRVIIPRAAPDEGSFSRASTATYVDERTIVCYSAANAPRYQNGRLLLEAAADNLLQYSEDLRNTAEAGSARPWGQFDDTGNAVAVLQVSTVKPDGTTANTSKLTANTTGALQRQVSQTISGMTDNANVVVSVFLKAAEVPRAALLMGTKAGTYPSATFDLVGMAMVSSSGVVAAGIELLAGGWCRCWLSANISNGGTTPGPVIQLRNASNANYGGAIGDGLYIWGAQVEYGISPTSYIPRTGTATASRAADGTFSGDYMACSASPSIGLGINYVSEDAADAWVSGTSYAVGDEVHVAATHRVYRRLVAGAGTTSPESDTTNWRDVRSTSRWAPVTLTENTPLQALGNLYFSLSGAGVSGLYLGGVVAQSVLLTVVSSANAIRTTRYVELPAPVATWTDGAEGFAYIDLQGVTQTGDRIDISLIGSPVGASSGIAVASLRYLVAGQTAEVGDTIGAPRLGIIDYSRRETDEFGTTTFVRRSYAKRMNVEVMLPNSDLSRVFNLLAEVRASVCLWVPALSDNLEPLTFFGWCKEFDIAVAYTSRALCTMEIEGMA